MLPLVDLVEQALVERRYDAVGAALNDGWMLKQKMASQISDEEINSIYQSALAAGALGGKIAGAGGGGFLLLYVPPEHQNHVRHALAHLFELPFMPERDGSKGIFNMKRYPFK
jgi:D-glycero-alpha-D-manno-heptose-7-phosphate kinase